VHRRLSDRRVGAHSPQTTSDGLCRPGVTPVPPGRGRYYAFTTASEYVNIPDYTSTDLARWSRTPGDGRNHLPKWTTAGKAWAPGVVELGGSEATDDGVIEAPYMVEAGGSDVLLLSRSQWESAFYAVSYTVCSGPLGPCTRPDAAPARVVRRRPGTGWGVLVSVGGTAALPDSALIALSEGGPDGRVRSGSVALNL